MEALFLSRLNKHFRGWIALSFLLASLLGTHWIGFAHGIAHSGLNNQAIELSCSDQSVSAQHSSASCHLYDALTLASFAISSTSSFIDIALYNRTIPRLNTAIAARFNPGLYQSRAPPSFIL